MLNQSLSERFTNAERILQECRDNVPENLKMKLYGLSKQAKEGDCRMPMPPRYWIRLIYTSQVRL